MQTHGSHGRHSATVWPGGTRGCDCSQ